MIKLPFQLIASGAALLLKTAEDLQLIVNDTADGLTAGCSCRDGPGTPVAQREAALDAALASETLTHHNALKEPDMYDNYEGSSHDEVLALKDKVKYVSYSIRFAKPDHQALLFEETDFPINYSTNTDSFAALRYAEFRARLARSLRIPAAWQDGNHPRGEYGYDNPDNPTTYSDIPLTDHKHIEIKITKVDSSSEKKETSEVDAIREVRDAIRNIWN
jgi:hypothetical protein